MLAIGLTGARLVPRLRQTNASPLAVCYCNAPSPCSRTLPSARRNTHLSVSLGWALSCGQNEESFPEATCERDWATTTVTRRSSWLTCCGGGRKHFNSGTARRGECTHNTLHPSPVPVSVSPPTNFAARRSSGGVLLNGSPSNNLFIRTLQDLRKLTTHNPPGLSPAAKADLDRRQPCAALSRRGFLRRGERRVRCSPQSWINSSFVKLDYINSS